MVTNCDEIGAELSLTPHDVNSALKFFHHLTALLYFPDIIGDTVFLDSQPLFEKLSKLIAVSFADGADYYEALEVDFKNNMAHDNMKNKGVFDSSLLKDIGFQFMEFNYESFLKLLESLQVIIRLPKTQTETYFLPCVLATANPFNLDELKQKFSKTTDPFVLKWKERVIPQGLYCALVLCLLQEEAIGSEDFIGVKQQFRNAITLPCESKFGGSLLLVDATSHLEVYYSGKVENCPHIRDIIFSQVIEAAKAFHYDLSSSRPDICFIDSSSKEIVPFDHCPLRSKAWVKKDENPAPISDEDEEIIPDVTEATRFLDQCQFNYSKHLDKLTSELDLTDNDLDHILDDSAFRQTAECLAIWLKNNPGSKWKILKEAVQNVRLKN